MVNLKIILTRGLPASGKSTWAKKWVAEAENYRVRINFDDIRNMMGPYNHDFWSHKGKKKILMDMFRSFVNNAMLYSFDIVIDNMNLSDSAVNQVKELVSTFNRNCGDTHYDIEFKDFLDIPVEECIERDSLRSNPIGEKAIKQIYRTHKDKIIRINTEKKYNRLKQYEDTIDSNKPNCIIVDMDGTVCFNLSGRPYYGKNSYKGMAEDKLYVGVQRLILNFWKSSGNNDKIFFVSGRDGDANTYQSTKDYVINNILKDNIDSIDIDRRVDFLLRPTGNYESTSFLKKSLVQNYIIDNYNILYVIDDDKRCVNTYREMGLTVLQP
jgi:predicted kinase